MTLNLFMAISDDARYFHTCVSCLASREQMLHHMPQLSSHNAVTQCNPITALPISITCGHDKENRPLIEEMLSKGKSVTIISTVIQWREISGSVAQQSDDQYQLFTVARYSIGGILDQRRFLRNAYSQCDTI